MLSAHAAYYFPFLADDSLITLRYARRILEGAGPTWTDGPAVEGYSNLLWLLLCTGLGAIGFDLVVACRILGVVGTGAVVVALGFASKGIPLPALAAAQLVVALSGTMAVWTVGGLEQPLVAGLLAGALVLVFRFVEEEDAPGRTTIWWASGLLGLLCITRPDGPLFTAAIAGALWWRPASPRAKWNTAARLVSIPVALYSAQMAFRLLYYGAWVPNTALAKISPSVRHTLEGLTYLRDGAIASLPLSLFALVSIALAASGRVGRARGVILLAVGGLWSIYLAFVGADHFAGFRHFAPIVVVFAFATLYGVEAVWARLATRRARAAGALCLLLMLGGYVRSQFADPQIRVAKNERWEWYGRGLGELLRSSFAEEQPLLAVTAAGCLPYWSELPSLDMLGLNDHYLPRHKPPDFGTRTIGHELGNGAYVMRRAPDLVFFDIPGPGQGLDLVYRVGEELGASPEFLAEYTPIHLQVAEPDSHHCWIWVRRSSEKIGVRRDGEELIVPAYLLNENPETVSAVGPNGRLGTRIAPSRPAYAILELPDRDWVVTGLADSRSRAGVRRNSDGRFEVRLEASASVTVEDVVLRAPVRDDGSEMSRTCTDGPAS